MHLLLVGLSHHTAPVELRERVDFAHRGVDRALADLASRRATGEVAVLSTCNRVEVYASCDDTLAAAQEILGFLADFHEVTRDELAPHVYTLTDPDVARHLFRVASGLDSLVVGEPQILGQVKEAYSLAADQNLTGALLNKLFHWAFAVGKRVRTETGLAEGAVSVSYAAISLARKIFGKLDGRRVLVLGAGEMSKLTAIHLRAQHVAQITIASRTMASAEALASRLDATAIPWQSLGTALYESDIVVTATGATEPILSRPTVEEVMRVRRNRPLFLIDIAVPRDVEASCGELEQVFLYNIDDLQAIVTENLTRRSRELQHAEGIVTDEVGKFTAWMRSRSAIPTVVALRQRFETIRRAELKRLEPKLAQLGPEARARVDEITHLIVEKLLLTPTEQLKGLSDDALLSAYSDALARLFSLSADDLEPTSVSDDTD